MASFLDTCARKKNPPAAISGRIFVPGREMRVHVGRCSGFHNGRGTVRTRCGREAFVHQGDIHMPGFRFLRPGERVAFELPDGRRARRVSSRCSCVAATGTQMRVPPQVLKAIVGEAGSNLGRINALCSDEVRFCSLHGVVHARRVDTLRVVARHVSHRLRNVPGTYQHPQRAVQVLMLGSAEGHAAAPTHVHVKGNPAFVLATPGSRSEPPTGWSGLADMPPEDGSDARGEFVGPGAYRRAVLDVVEAVLREQDARFYSTVYVSFGKVLFYSARDRLPRAMPAGWLEGQTILSPSPVALKTKLQKQLCVDADAVRAFLERCGFEQVRSARSKRLWVIDRATGDKWSCSFLKRDGRWVLAYVYSASLSPFFASFVHPPEVNDFRLAIRSTLEVLPGDRMHGRIRRFVRGCRWHRDNTVSYHGPDTPLELDSWNVSKQERQYVRDFGGVEVRVCVTSVRSRSEDTEVSCTARRGEASLDASAVHVLASFAEALVSSLRMPVRGVHVEGDVLSSCAGGDGTV